MEFPTLNATHTFSATFIKAIDWSQFKSRLSPSANLHPMLPTALSTPIYIQQDAMLHILFISGNYSIYFGCYLHPSSRAHTTVSTASGTCQTGTATCRYSGRVGTGFTSSNSSTIAADSSTGLTSARFCKYSCVLLMMGGDTTRNM